VSDNFLKIGLFNASKFTKIAKGFILPYFNAYICVSVARKGLFWLLLIIYAVGRFLFPPLEYTGDSYGYACELIKGELWNSHHLLHKYFLKDLWLILQPLHLTKDPLLFFSSLHLLVSLGCVFVLVKILEHRHWSQSRIYLALLFILSGFAFTKYNIENEVYFYPILLSLIGSYLYENNKPYRAAMWLGFATLFHQIHIFWLIGLLFPRDWKQYRNYYPLILGLFVPVLTYSAVGLTTGTSINILLFQDVEAGLVQIIPNLKNFVFLAVNSVRLLFQIHGDIALFWNLWSPYYSGIAILLFIFVLLGAVVYLRERRYRYQKSDWYRAYVWAFLLQFLFAWYSVGNIEFMILLPFLFILTLRNGSLLKHSMLFSVGLFVWNTTQWFIPMAKTRPNRIHDQISISHRIIQDDQNDRFYKNPNPILVYSQNAATAQNAYEYDYLLDSLNTDERMDSTMMKQNGKWTGRLKFVPFQGERLQPGYWLSFDHGRMNRTKLSYESGSIPPEQEDVKFTRLYRDTGINGVLELYRISPLN
jgi:hypothetical protein